MKVNTEYIQLQEDLILESGQTCHTLICVVFARKIAVIKDPS